MEAQPWAGAARVRWPRMVAPACALVAVCIAVAALLRRWREAGMPMDDERAIMVPATALALILAAGALLLLTRPVTGAWSTRLARLAATLALADALVVLAIHLDVELVGAMLPDEPWWTHLPGPLTALGLTLAGLALLAVSRRRVGMLRLANGLAAAMLVLALLGLVGHVHGEKLLYGAHSEGATGLSTVFAVAALAIGVLFAHPERGVAAVAGSGSAGGRLLRRLVPVVVLAPVLLGWAALVVEEKGWLPAGPASALPAVMLIVVLVGLGVRQSFVLHGLDMERERNRHERERLLLREQKARIKAERGQEALERMTESRASLMRGFGHDVKNPLGTAQLHAELLERTLARGQRSVPEQESVRVIRRSLRSALQLIDDLLSLAQAEAGQLTLKCSPTDASGLVHEVAADTREQAAAAKMRLEVHAPAPLTASADPARLRQILGNLVSNAIKYAPGGRLAIEARLRSSGGPGPGRWVAITVNDSGPGIPADKHELVFKEYARLGPDAAPGAGIGLAISRRFARLMGGDITVASEPGHGASFTLWLPPAADERDGMDAASAA